MLPFKFDTHGLANTYTLHPRLTIEIAPQHALLALNETVRMAQQHSDDTALAHALVQLCRLLAGTTPAAASAASGDGSSAAHHSQLHRLLQRWAPLGTTWQVGDLGQEGILGSGES